MIDKSMDSQMYWRKRSYRIEGTKRSMCWNRFLSLEVMKYMFGGGMFKNIDDVNFVSSSDEVGQESDENTVHENYVLHIHGGFISNNIVLLYGDADSIRSSC